MPDISSGKSPSARQFSLEAWRPGRNVQWNRLRAKFEQALQAKTDEVPLVGVVFHPDVVGNAGLNRTYVLLDFESFLEMAKYPQVEVEAEADGEIYTFRGSLEGAVKFLQQDGMKIRSLRT